MRLFADNCVVYREIVDLMIMKIKCYRKITDACPVGRKHVVYCRPINVLFSKSLIPINIYSIKVTSLVGGTTLQETNSHSYLGVEINKDVRWKLTYIKYHLNINILGTCVLGFIKRDLSNRNAEINFKAFNSLV